MTSYQLVAHLETLLSATSDHHVFMRYLQVLARGRDQTKGIANGSPSVRTNRVRYNRRPVSPERTYDLKKQSQSFPLGKIFHELIELQKTLVDLHDVFEEMGDIVLQDIKTQVESFYKSFEAYVRDQDDEDAIETLVERASQLHTSINAARQAFSTVKKALYSEGHPNPDDQLSILFEQEQAYDALIDKLTALGSAYRELCDVAGISCDEHPLEIVKVETGSLWVQVRGHPQITTMLKTLLQRFTVFLYQRFSANDTITKIPERVVATQSLINLSDELARARLQDSEQDEVRLRRTALALAQYFVQLIAGEPTVRINRLPFALEESARPRFVEACRNQEGEGVAAANLIEK